MDLATTMKRTRESRVIHVWNLALGATALSVSFCSAATEKAISSCVAVRPKHPYVSKANGVTETPALGGYLCRFSASARSLAVSGLRAACLIYRLASGCLAVTSI